MAWIPCWTTCRVKELLDGSQDLRDRRAHLAHTQGIRKMIEAFFESWNARQILLRPRRQRSGKRQRSSCRTTTFPLRARELLRSFHYQLQPEPPRASWCAARRRKFEWRRTSGAARPLSEAVGLCERLSAGKPQLLWIPPALCPWFYLHPQPLTRRSL